MSTSDSAACAIGALRAAGGAPIPQGSGLAVGKDAASSKYYLSSWRRVYNQIKKLHTDGVVVGGVTKVLPGAYLDPSVHGVAIGFSSGSGGPIRWLENAAGDGFARATVAHADGGPLLFEPPSTHTPDGLDLVVLQLEASEPLHMLTLANEPLKQGEDMTLKGFGKPAKGMNVILRPVFCKFSVLNPRGASNPSGPWIESDLDDQPGHSGGPLLNTKDQAVGWCVRSRPTYQQGIAIPSGRSEVRPIALLKEKLDTIVGIQMPAPASGTPQNAATVNDILVQNLHLAAVLDAVCPNDPQPDNNDERLEKLRGGGRRRRHLRDEDGQAEARARRARRRRALGQGEAAAAGAVSAGAPQRPGRAEVGEEEEAAEAGRAGGGRAHPDVGARQVDAGDGLRRHQVHRDADAAEVRHARVLI